MSKVFGVLLLLLQILIWLIIFGWKKYLKSGTIFTLTGDVCGYDITLFNYYDEEEILMEPERKFIIDEAIPPINDIIHIRCEIKNTPLVLMNKNQINNNINNNNNILIHLKNF